MDKRSSDEETPERAPATMLPTLITLLTMGAFGVMGGALIAPTLPTLSVAFGVAEDRVGLVLSVYTLSAAFALPFIGLLIDRIGRKPVAIACLLIDGIFGVSSTFAPDFNILLLFRFFQGLGIAGLIPIAMTVLGDLFKERNLRLKLMGILSGTISGAAALVPILGGALAELDWRYPFFVYGFSLLLAAAFATLVPETRDTTGIRTGLVQEITHYLRRMKEALGIPRVKETFAHAFILYFSLYSLVTYLPLFLVDYHGLSSFWAGMGLAVQASLAVIVASRANWVDEKWNWTQKLTIGFGLMILSLATLPYWPSLLGVVASLLIFGMGLGFVQPAVYHEATAAPPKELAGSVVALFNTMKYIGMSASPFVLGFVAAYFPTSVLFLVSGGLCAFWVVFFNRRALDARPS
ncbi:MAG: MFS transporter [Clostridia bacterium]